MYVVLRHINRTINTQRRNRQRFLSARIPGLTRQLGYASHWKFLGSLLRVSRIPTNCIMRPWWMALPKQISLEIVATPQYDVIYTYWDISVLLRDIIERRIQMSPELVDIPESSPAHSPASLSSSPLPLSRFLCLSIPPAAFSPEKLSCLHFPLFLLSFISKPPSLSLSAFPSSRLCLEDS